MREQTVKLAAIMTAPRYEATYARNYIERALRELHIPLTVSQGVFYGQCMQMMLEQLVDSKSEIDYAIVVDFDSMFSAKHIQRLINWICERDDIDAITGMQVRRGKPAMLGTIPGGHYVDAETRQVPWDGNPIRATSAHFGLTVLDIRKLEKVPKPWFCSKPDDNGQWTEKKIDDDVSFWMAWKEAGNSIYIDPGVRIGHLEEMIAIHDETMTAHHIYPSEWEKITYGSNTPQTVATV